MTDPSMPFPAEEVAALMNASGLPLDRATAVVKALEESGWELQEIPPTPAERRRRRAADKKALKGFRI